MAVQKRICRHRRIIVIVQMQRVVITGQRARLMHVIVVTASVRMQIDFGAAISSDVSKNAALPRRPMDRWIQKEQAAAKGYPADRGLGGYTHDSEGLARNFLLQALAGRALAPASMSGAARQKAAIKASCKVSTETRAFSSRVGSHRTRSSQSDGQPRCCS